MTKTSRLLVGACVGVLATSALSTASYAVDLAPEKVGKEAAFLDI